MQWSGCDLWRLSASSQPLVWRMNIGSSITTWPGRWSAVSRKPSRPSCAARFSCCPATWSPGSDTTSCAPPSMSPAGSGAPPSGFTLRTKTACSLWGASSRIQPWPRPLNSPWCSRWTKKMAGTYLIPAKCWSWGQSTSWWRGSSTPLKVRWSTSSASGQWTLFWMYAYTMLGLFF